ncbi:MAG: sulfotransferase domain-containing protein [Chloroflexota bacterium]
MKALVSWSFVELRSCYRTIFPVQLRLLVHTYRLRVWNARRTWGAASAAAAPASTPEEMPSNISPPIEVPPEPQQNPGLQIAQIMQTLLQNGSYREYEALWMQYGFTVAPDYVLLPSACASVQFEDNLPKPLLKNGFLPSLFLLGAAKAGTSTLYEYLRRSPLICMSNPKEPFFFEAQYDLGLEYYRKRYFPHWNGEPIVGEARHRNLYLPYVPRRIAEVNPRAQLLVILRNPIERAYSHWWYWYARGVERLSFRDAVYADYQRIEQEYSVQTPAEIDRYRATLDSTGKGCYRTYLDSGYYFEQISRYRQLFPPEQLKVVLLDDLRTEPYQTIREIESFLGVPYSREADFEVIRANPHTLANGSPYGQIDVQTEAWLIDHFKPHNRKLEEFLQHDLSHWDRINLSQAGD